MIFLTIVTVFADSGPRFFSELSMIISMTSKQRKDRVNGKLSRFKLFFINLVIIFGKKGGTHVFFVSTDELKPEIVS